MGDKKYKQSKAEIAKQFNLPERQSKITTLLNQAGQQYCICRSSDSSRFMIACDACEEWYHGDCINISEREAKYIKNYFCDRCREEDPTLKTRFRPQKRENDGEVAPREDRKKKRKEKDHSENKSSKRQSNKDGCGDCPGCLQINDCGQIKKKHHEREQHEPEESLAHLQTAEARQCYGPQCTRPAQFGSKYCSGQCGMRLATARIYQVMCPEHFKDPKVGDHDVCGCPLVRNVFKPTGEFCRAPKKSCLKHYQWEKLRRAEIDMERVRQWLKLDELVEQERSIRLAMASRAGVLGLMLHSTYNHEVMERITTKATENGKVKETS
ncbi:hypothetical protein HF086_001031 [Spodoptera exigua]|uniref:CXXC-type zinc finger protein 1 n=1 Tax=Spodoptera exigua TaxID=7107 RepID=A0A922M6F2_SPOEX|nr:hypothetical protein HF086_001031 [Spodoptera exigua]